MKHTFEVPTYEPVVSGSTEITLPHYYICGSFGQVFCCMSEDMVLTTVMSYSTNKQIEVRKYDSLSQIVTRMEVDMRDRHYKIIDAEVFMHMFSEAHREVFYAVNPKLRPKL